MLLSVLIFLSSSRYFLFFFNDTATTEIYTLSLHDALPIYACFSRINCSCIPSSRPRSSRTRCRSFHFENHARRDRKSTRLNSSHVEISYAVFCLKKKKEKNERNIHARASNPAQDPTLAFYE